MVMLNLWSAISQSKSQQSVTSSVAEAECIALSICVSEILWTMNALSEIGVRDSAKSIVYQDNKSTIVIALNNRY